MKTHPAEKRKRAPRPKAVKVQRVVGQRRDTVIMRCLKTGCPRTRRIPRSKDIGKNVAEIHSYCPWHEKGGQKEYPEIFYDVRGRTLDGYTWRII